MSTATAHSVQPLTDAQRRMFRGSFFLFIIAETMIFVTLFSTRFLLAGTGHPDTLNQPLGGAITVLLIVSLWPLSIGLSRVQRGERGAKALWLAVLPGVLAVVLIVYDWMTLAVAVGSRYGENYVLSTGYHAVHIGLGLAGLAVVAGADQRGNYQRENHWQVEAAAVFWLFVVVSWIALYAIFFLV